MLLLVLEVYDIRFCKIYYLLEFYPSLHRAFLAQISSHYNFLVSYTRAKKISPWPSHLLAHRSLAIECKMLPGWVLPNYGNSNDFAEMTFECKLTPGD